eukprot:224516-Chlamydomonas_euryale.AAC.1
MEVAVETAPKKSIWVEEVEEDGSAAAITLAPLLHWHKPLMQRVEFVRAERDAALSAARNRPPLAMA